MPVAAVDVEAFEEAAKKIHDKLLTGEKLSPFDRGRFEILADRHPHNEVALQLRGMLRIAEGDEDGLHACFAKALMASKHPSVVHVNYAITLTYWGDHEEAAKQLALALKNPVEIIRTGCLPKCLWVSEMLDDEELTERLVRMAEQYGLPAGEAESSVLCNLLGRLPDNDPLLLAALDAMPEGWGSGDRIVKRVQRLVEEIEADHA